MLVLNSDGKRGILKGAVTSSLTSSKESFGQSHLLLFMKLRFIQLPAHAVAP